MVIRKRFVLPILAGIGILLFILVAMIFWPWSSVEVSTAPLTQSPLPPEIPTHPLLTEINTAKQIATDFVITDNSTQPPATVEPTVEQSITASPERSQPTPITAEPLPPKTGVIIIEDQQAAPGLTQVFNLPEGLYRIVYATDAQSSTVTPIVKEGECSDYAVFDLIAPFDGSATYRSMGCKIQFEITGRIGTWHLAVERFPQKAMKTPPVSFSGEGPGTTDIVSLPAGEYVISLDTNSEYSAVTSIVQQGPCREWPIIQATGPGTYQTEYTSDDCQIIFEIGSVTSEWTLHIELKP